MLQTLREFARERLREDGEDEAAGRRHARYFMEFAEQAEPRLQGAAQQAWLARVGREHDNLRAAIQFSVQHCEVEPALRLSGALWRFWWLRGHLHEGTYWLGQALALPGDVADAARAKALHAAGKLARERGDRDAAEAFARESLALFRAQADEAGVALALNTLGNVVGDRADYAGARRLYAESLELRVRLDDTDGTALALHNLSAVARADGRLDEAARLGAESLDLFTALDDRWGVGIGLANLARIALLRDDSAGADLLARESLQVRQSLGDRQGTVRCLEILGQVAVARGESERAARLLSAVDGLRDAIGMQRPLDEQSAHESNLARVREGLERERFEAAARAGRAMSLEATVAFAGSAPAASAVRAPESGLSPREVEVAYLIAEGMTNRQIAERLVISKWTADNHVASILRKLDLTTRAQVAGWVAAGMAKDGDRAAPPAPTRADS
jgi:non-specific serine/threonine protein kinase